jgi:hypothetical protein
MGLNRNLGQLTEALTESSGNVLLNPNNVVGGTNVYIGQTMATNDAWRIYGNTIATDSGEMVFEVGDNAIPIAPGINGQRFRFHYDNSSSGVAKSPFILNYDYATFNTNASFTGNVSIGTENATGQSSDNRVIQIYGSGFANRAQIHFVNANTGESSSDGTFIGIDSNKDFFINNTEGATIFENNGTERARISSSGLKVVGTANNAIPYINFETTSANNTFNWVSTAFASNLATGNNLIHFIGQGASSKNAAYFGFKYAGSGTDSNLLSLGLFAVDNVLNINGLGNVGIGTEVPLKKLQIDVVPLPGEDNGINVYNGTTRFLFTRTGSSYNYKGVAPLSGMIYCENNISLLSDGGNITFNNSGSERMRISSVGDLLLGTQVNPGSGNYKAAIIQGGFDGLYISVNQSPGGHAIRANRNGDGDVIFISRNGTNVGSISVSGSVTSYNVTSDYRLKQDFKPFNGLDLVSKIKVYDYEWKDGNKRMNGVIAHELQEVVPYAVTGKKDAKEMQSVDYSKLVPILVKAIQELKAEIEILKQNK